MRILASLSMAVAMWATPASAMDFIHPGAINSKEELDFVKVKIQTRCQPWLGEFDRLANSGYATRGPHGLTHIDSQRGDAAISRDDALAAYSQALLWYFAVFNEDEELFNQGLERLNKRSQAYIYLAADGAMATPIDGDGGNVPAFWSHPTSWIDGLTQETCRDNGHHAQFGLGSAIHAAEVAWHQGVDVYAEHQERYTSAMELMAKQFLTGSMQGVCRNDVADADRYDSWEVGYNHYHRRVGLDLPNTRKLILEQIRPNAPRAVNNLAYETLTHADLPITTPAPAATSQDSN